MSFLLEDGRQHRVREISAFTARGGGQATDGGGVPGGGVLAAAVQHPGHHLPVASFQRPSIDRPVQ